MAPKERKPRQTAVMVFVIVELRMFFFFFFNFEGALQTYMHLLSLFFISINISF